jgi:predicted hydrocarbon binding protein
MDNAMADLAKQGFQALVDAFGVPDAIAAVKPYKNRNAYVLMCMVKKKMGLKGPGIETLITPMCMAQVGIGGVDRVHSEIRERGAVCFVDKCPYQDAIPEFCVVVSHYTTDLICEALNPEYECVWTHHLSDGDPYCRYVYRKKAEHHSSIDDLGRTIKTIPRFEVPKEDERALKDYVLFNVLDAVVEGHIDLQGSEKALNALIPLAKKIGSDTGARLAKENPRMKNDAATIGHLIDLFGQAIMQRGSSEILSKAELRKEITDCPFQTFPYEMCKTMEAMLRGVVRSLNPDLAFEYQSMMTKGDQTCRWHVRDKNAKTTIVHDERAEAANPLAMLKMRLAKGDISKDEYEEIRALISS